MPNTHSVWLTTLLALGAPQARAHFNKAPANVTVQSTYTAVAGDTIFTIANQFNRGVCDIARLNRFSFPETDVYAGQELLIPSVSMKGNDTTCLLTTDSNPSAKCVLGGPHTYTTLENDTARIIAEQKFNITMESLIAVAVGEPYSEIPDPEQYFDYILPTGTILKLPLCEQSACTMIPFELIYATFKDVSDMFGSSPGQISGFNPGYNHSVDTVLTEGAWLSIPTNCRALARNLTVVS